jgi:succinate-semialdehyde dehydrogenase/glutarate-semialdehyde dehydrogenase
MGAMEAATQPTAPAQPGTLDSFNPATGEKVGSVATVAPGQVQGIVDEVAEVQPFWAQLSLDDRARYMRRTAQVIIDSLDELSLLLAREQGKPRSEAYTMELLPTIDGLHWIADNGPKLLSDEKLRYPQIFWKAKKSWIAHEPLGVVGVIAPWNYPWSIPFGEVAIALMCGNGVVLKPASLTPLIGERIQRVFERAGVPEGLVRTVHGGGRVGNALV